MPAPLTLTGNTRAGFAGPALSAPLSAPASPWAALCRMWTAVTTREQLAALDDRMLHDLGLSRADVARELARAPWDTRPLRRGDRGM